MADETTTDETLSNIALSNIALAENTFAAAVFDAAEADETLFGTAEPAVLCAHEKGFAEQLTSILAQNLLGAVVVRCGEAGTVRYQPAGKDGAIVPVGDMNATVEVYLPLLATGVCAEAETIAQAILSRLDGAAFETPFTPKPVITTALSQGDTLTEDRIRYHVATVSLAFELMLTTDDAVLAEP